MGAFRGARGEPARGGDAEEQDEDAEEDAESMTSRTLSPRALDSLEIKRPKSSESIVFPAGTSITRPFTITAPGLAVDLSGCCSAGDDDDDDGGGGGLRPSLEAANSP